MKHMKMQHTRFTKEGFEKFKLEYNELLASRPAAVLDLKKARELGDLSENGYYKAARMKLSSIDSRLFRMKLAIKQAVVYDDSRGDLVSIGKSVVLTNGDQEMRYRIVGDLEANPKEGKISLMSPLGRAIEGKRVGERVDFRAPSGTLHYLIKEIS